MKKTIAFISIILALASCKKEEVPNKLIATNWIIGNWEKDSEEGKLMENWVGINDSVSIGVAYFIKGIDTLHNESIVLTQKGENLFYISNVKGQNDNKPIPFRLTNFSSKKLIFENLKNDFPQKIVYNQITKDSLLIEVFGIQQGKSMQEKYKLSRKLLLATFHSIR